MMAVRLPLLLLAGLLVVACGGAPDSGTQVLNRGLASDPESLDPHKARSVQSLDVLRDIGEGLMSYSATGELVAGAAERWELSDDGRTWSFAIRDAARWSNGEPVTAQDFESSLKRLVDPATTSFYAQMLLDVVADVRASDDRTLHIRLRQPTPYFLDLLTHPSTFPIHMPSFEQHGDGFVKPGRFVSNGAYKLHSRLPGSLLTLKRNPHYWNNASVAIDEVRHHVITQEVTELNRFRSGELHITSVVPPDGFEQTRRAFGEQLRIAPYLGVYYYGFNLGRPPFRDNPKLRKALSLAIDRDVLVDKVLGRGEVAAWGWVAPGTANYGNAEFDYAQLEQQERNAMAQSLYTEAGYGDSNPLQIELRYNTSDTHQRVALAVSSMWREVLGVQTELVNEELRVFLSNTRQREVTQVFKGSWIGDFNDAQTFLGVLKGAAPTNTPGYVNERYDGLLAEAASARDPGRRQALLEQAEGVLLADHAVMPLYFYVSKHLVSPEVRGWGDNVLDYHYSQHLSLSAAE